jgi:hypothetical protein
MQAENGPSAAVYRFFLLFFTCFKLAHRAALMLQWTLHGPGGFCPSRRAKAERTHLPLVILAEREFLGYAFL